MIREKLETLPFRGERGRTIELGAFYLILLIGIVWEWSYKAWFHGFFAIEEL